MMPALLQDDIDLVVGELEKLDKVLSIHPVYSIDYGAAALLAAYRLTEAGAVIGARGDAQTISFRGVRAESTAGLAGALRNWANAARKKLNQQGKSQ